MTNLRGVTCVVLGSVLALAAACSGSKTAPVFDSGGASGTFSLPGAGGKPTLPGGGMGGMATVASPLAPQVTITSPVAATDPNVGPVVIGNQITVLCSVTESTETGAKPVDGGSVKIAMLDATGTSLKSVTGIATTNLNEYSALFQLTGVASGPVSFQCTANDTASPANTGTATVDTLLDQGPTITMGDPAANSAHNLLDIMSVAFTVTAAPITASDKQAAVSGVTLQVAGTTIPTTAIGAGVYQASVNFGDKTVFAVPPSGQTPIVISATDSRTAPGKATGTVQYDILVDGLGPVINIATPLAGAVIGRASVLAFSVTDAGSGVDPKSVTVTINDAPDQYSTTTGLWSTDGAGNYTYNMGTKLAAKTYDTDSQVTIDVLASDNAQNPSKGNSRLFSLDTQPPVVDLDPPDTYFLRGGSAPMTTQCSDLFDPVGSAAPSDLSTVTNFGRFRSLVWDMTNSKAGQQDFFFALADQTSARLYVQPDTTQPLLADLDGDGVCDEIWTGSAPFQKRPTDQALQFVALTALPSETDPEGAVVWGGVNAPADPTCAPGSVSGPVPTLCSGASDMTMILHHPVVITPHEPVIYSVQPMLNQTPPSPLCTGSQWDVAAAISMASTTTTPQLGWVCIAARVLDRVGNPGISAPLRICLDDGTNPNRCNGIAPPSCTDNCTPPPHFQVPPVPFAGYD